MRTIYHLPFGTTCRYNISRTWGSTSYVCPSRSLESHQFPNTSRTRRFRVRCENQHTSRQPEPGLTRGGEPARGMKGYPPCSAVSGPAGRPPRHPYPPYAGSGLSPGAGCTRPALLRREERAHRRRLQKTYQDQLLIAKNTNTDRPLQQQQTVQSN